MTNDDETRWLNFADAKLGAFTYLDEPHEKLTEHTESAWGYARRVSNGAVTPFDPLARVKQGEA